MKFPVAEKSGQQNALASVAFRSIAQFYDMDDPSPEDHRQLSDRAEERIFRAVLDVPRGYSDNAFKRIEMVFPASELSPGRDGAIIAATRAHFLARAPDFERDRRLTWRVGLREFRLTIAVCIPAFAGIAICSQFKGNAIAEVAENVLVIFAWVVIWQPFGSLVFDRWTQRVTGRVYRHIAEMEITVRAG